MENGFALSGYGAVTMVNALKMTVISLLVRQCRAPDTSEPEWFAWQHGLPRQLLAQLGDRALLSELKMERVQQRDYANLAEATIEIADYIVNSYNCQRLHFKLGNSLPNALAQPSAINQAIGLCETT